MTIDNVKTSVEKHKYTNLKDITANGWDRIKASIVDLVFFLAITIPVVWALSYTGLLVTVGWLKYVVLLFIFLAEVSLYFVVPVYKQGQTIGKKIMGIRIISENGGDVYHQHLVIRNIYYAIPKYFFGVIVLGDIIILTMVVLFIISLVKIFNHPFHQTVHDNISGVYVVYDKLYIDYKLEENTYKKPSYF